MLKKAYVEITNICNLSCPFCHGTNRKKQYMSVSDFFVIAKKLREHTDYIYLHVLGEPLMHPELDNILKICSELNYKVCITTNGTLLKSKQDILLSCQNLYKISISLHAYEVNSINVSLEEYLSGCISFVKAANEKNTLCSFRLWNTGGQSTKNSDILNLLKTEFGSEWTENKNGYTLKKGIFLEFANLFSWPDITADEINPTFCMGLRDQIGVLCDGTAVPCCLDAEGSIALGNLLTDSAESILKSERAANIVSGFSSARANEELCKKCGYAKQMFG